MKKHGRWASTTACLLFCVLIIGLLNIFVGHKSAQFALSRNIVATPWLKTVGAISTKNNSSTCMNVRKLYHIGIADIEGGVGTALYQLVINQLLYAERYNLTPWVHLLPNVSKVIDDPSFSDNGKPIHLHVQATSEPEDLRGGPHRRHIVPGPPVVTADSPTTITVPGDGIWKHYFHPVSDFDPSCSSNVSSYITTGLNKIHLVIPGLHGFDGIRCWRYDYLPEYIRRPHQSWTRWIASSRQLAAPLVQRYVQPQPFLLSRATDLVDTDTSTLGLHIRHSDKAAGRRVIDTAEFLPFAEAFVAAGGQAIYVATDSARVVEHLQTEWPLAVAAKIRTAPHMIRSSNTTAVFAKGDHHRTNMEAIVEILALSRCRFLVHGHSAVSEAAIWTHPHLHYTAVNLEDEHHLNATTFGRLVEMEMEGSPQSSLPKAIHEEERWIDETIHLGDPPREPTHSACTDVNGVFWISVVLKEDETAAAFFRSVLSQVAYAKEHNLKPWIHLTSASLIYDPQAHGGNKVNLFTMIDGMKEFGLPLSDLVPTQFAVQGNGIWNHYFEPISDFVPGDSSCFAKPLVSMNENDLRQLLKTQDRLMSSRLAQEIQIRQYLIGRSQQMRPQGKGPCLGVHIALANKQGNKRKVTAAEFLLHMEAYVRAGGTCIYLATDTQRVMKYIKKNFPPSITSIIQSQGDHIVRSEGGDWPTHMLDDHHRVNVETLVDVIGISKCQLLLHTNKPLSDAAIDMNDSIHSVDMEDRDKRMSPLQFEKLCRYVLGVDKELQDVPNEEQGHRLAFIEPRIIEAQHKRTCRSNAIVYLAQKVHSSYNRDSYSNLLRSLHLLNRNYLSTNSHHLDTVDIFIFHTGDFNSSDMSVLEGQLTQGQGTIRLVDLSQTKYWARPEHQLKDKPEDWYAWPLFSEGYRRMMHWFAVDVWDFFADYNAASGCAYRYIFRLDEDSYIHSPIQYNVFDFMQSGDYVYGFRMCAYEMQVTQRMSKLWRKRHSNFVPQRNLDLEMCGFYNNFFIADLEFFHRSDVATFLRFIDREGHIYRRRLGDLMIHTMAVNWFSPQSKIHRFLDFTYEHGTFNKTDGCLLWGGIQAGHLDTQALEVSKFHTNMLSKGCHVNATTMVRTDLSPSYSHTQQDLALRTVTAGKVEIPGKGVLSG